MKLVRETSEPVIMPLVVVLSWCIVAVAVGYNLYTGGQREIQLDINGDGKASIADVWIIVRDSWLTATVLPLLFIVVTFEKLTPKVYSFLEIHSIMQHEVILVVLGFVCWFALFYYASRAEIAIRNVWTDRASNRVSKSVRAEMDAVARGDRDKFP